MNKDKYKESYVNVDGLLPPSPEGCARIARHLEAIGIRARITIEGDSYVAEASNGRLVLDIAAPSQSKD